MQATHDYWSTYYKRNRDVLQKSKRDRYKKDPAYRDSVRETALLYGKIKNLVKNLDSFPVVKVGDQRELALPLYKYSELFNYSYQTLKALEDTVLPQPGYMKGRGQEGIVSLYTQSQMSLLHHLLEESDVRDEQAIRKVLNKFWKGPYNRKEVDRYVKSVTKEKENGHKR